MCDNTYTVLIQKTHLHISLFSNFVVSSQEAYVSRTLYICKLPHNFNEDEIRQACAQYGDIRGVISYPTKQIAFVEYVSTNQKKVFR